MKKTLFVFLLLFFVVSAKAQTVTLTFTAQDSLKNRVQLDSVIIVNKERNWSETLKWPDTVLVMTNSTGISQQQAKGNFVLMQNTPNPFDGQTMVTLQVPANEKVRLTIYNVQGKEIASLQQMLPAGTHAFRILLSQPQTYLLHVRSGANQASVKMVNFGTSTNDGLEYMGASAVPASSLKQQNLVTDKLFLEGDTMLYTGFATIKEESCKSVSIQQAQEQSQTIMLSFSESVIPQLSVATDSVAQITYTEATAYGTIHGDEQAVVIARGFCWDTVPAPTKSDNVVTAGSGQGNYKAQLKGLTYGTTYYICAFAEYDGKTVYGKDVAFTTLNKTVPVLSTDRIRNVTSNSAEVTATLVSDGNDKVTVRGFCWDTQPNPTLSSQYIIVEGEQDVFTGKIADLKPKTRYFVRAFATNSVGTGYGNNAFFDTAEEEEVYKQQILLCEQATQAYNIYDFKTGDKIWSWLPAADATVKQSGYRFSNVSDAKPLYDGTCMMVVASGGGAAIVRLSDKKVLFLANPMGNTHSIELLPGNRVVTASTTGKFLKVYNIDTNVVKQTSPVFTLTFPNGHNVVWDSKRNCLWSAGDSYLHKFAYDQQTGKLTELAKYAFPTGCTVAHDFVKVWKEDRYIMTTEQKILEFDPNTNTFSDSDSYLSEHVKSVSTGPSGFKTIGVFPQEEWWTSVVSDYHTGEKVFERPNAKIYKARWWLWED